MLPDVNVVKCLKVNKITLFQNGMYMFILLSPRLVMTFFGVVTLVQNIAMSLLCPDQNHLVFIIMNLTFFCSIA